MNMDCKTCPENYSKSQLIRWLNYKVYICYKQSDKLFAKTILAGKQGGKTDGRKNTAWALQWRFAGQILKAMIEELQEA